MNLISRKQNLITSKLSYNFITHKYFKSYKYNHQLSSYFLTLSKHSFSDKINRIKEKLELTQKEIELQNKYQHQYDLDTLQESSSQAAKYQEEEVNIPVRVETGISAKILCELIGTKLYDYNDQIKISLDRMVACYDENDRLIGNKLLRDAFNFASEQKKDVVLRNDKSEMPIVKIIKYRIELIKRLIKKFSKNPEPVKGYSKESRTLFITKDIEVGDYDTKLNKAMDLLNQALILKVAISVKDLNNKEEIQTANRILLRFADGLSSVGKLKQKPTPKRKKDRESYSIDNIDTLKSQQEIENELNHADTLLKPLKAEQKETDFNALDIVYIELESLVIDKSGVDYEKLLETMSVESLSKGVSSGSFDEIYQQEQLNEEVTSEEEEVIVEDRRARKLRESKEKLKKLEQELQKSEKLTGTNDDDAYINFWKRVEFKKQIELEKLFIYTKETRKELFRISLIIHEMKTLGASTVKAEKPVSKRAKEKLAAHEKGKKKKKK